MAIDERSRHDLFSRLEEVLGKEHATVLMEHLPPVGWADVATKHDLDQLAARFDAKLDATKYELLATFRAELNTTTHEITRSLISAMVWVNSVSVLTVAGLAFAAAKLV